MANYYVSSVGWTAVAAWAASTAYSLGQYVRQLATPSVNNERVFRCTTAGTTAGTEPSWNINKGVTTTSGSAVFTECTGAEADNSAGNWTAPAARIGNITTRNTKPTSGEFIFISQDHAETQGSTWQPWTAGIDYSGISFICVARDGGSSLPPVTADLRTTATVSTTTSNEIRLGSGSNAVFYGVYWYGVSFLCGSGSSSADLRIDPGLVASGVTAMIFDNCLFHLNNTGGSSEIYIGNTVASFSSYQTVLFRNTSFKFGATGQSIVVDSCIIEWESSTALAAGSSVPNDLFSIETIPCAVLLNARGVDFSACGPLLSDGNDGEEWAFCTVDLRNCRLPAAVEVFDTLSAAEACPFDIGHNGHVRLDNCDDSTGNTNYRFIWYATGGNTVSEAAVVRDGGASDGTTPISWKTTTSNTTYKTPTQAHPYEIPTPLAKYNVNTGAAITATVYTLANSAAALTTAQIWLEIEALTNSGSPLSSFADDSAGNALPSTAAAAAAQTADTSDWSTGLTARANSTVYAAGAVVSVPGSAAGTAWFCTTGGTSSGSLPGGYSGATDGASVTDGTAVFRAGQRQKLAVTFTPQKAGFIKGRVNAAGASLSFYVDPTLNLS